MREGWENPGKVCNELICYASIWASVVITCKSTAHTRIARVREFGEAAQHRWIAGTIPAKNN